MARKRTSPGKGKRGAAARGKSGGASPRGKGGGTRAARRFAAGGVGPALLLVLAGLFVWHAVAFQYTQDDAYISLRYAKNLVDGHGLVWNPGERLEGYSNFTWTLLLAALIRMGAPPVETATWLGVFFGVAAMVVAARFARALEGRWGVASLGTAGLIAGTSAFALWSTGGLETALFAFLVTWGLERGLAPGVSERGRWAAPLLLAFAAMSRPDGPLVFAVWFGLRTLDTFFLKGPAAQPGGARTLARDLLLFLLPLIPYAVWKLWYYGDLLPNTYYAKAGTSPAYLQRGFAYLTDYVNAYAMWGVVPALALLALAREKLRSVEARVLTVWLAFAAYIIVIGGDVLQVHRFWLPILPVGALLVARGATWLGERAARRRGAPAGAAIAGGVILAVTAGGLIRNWDEIQGRRNTEIGFVLNMRQTGEWLGENLPPGSSVAITTIGAIGYYSGLHVIDMLGLTDREIARNPKMIDGLDDTWREIKYNAESVLARRPDAILFSTGVRPSAAAEKALYLYQDFYRSYFPYNFRSESNRTHVQVAFRLKPDAPEFVPELVGIGDFGFLDEYIDGHLAQSRHLDFEKAVEHFRRADEMSGGLCSWARQWLGAALYDSGREAEGLQILVRALEEDPYSILAMTRIADTQINSGNLEAASGMFERITTLDPDDALAWFGRAETTRLMGDPELAYRQGLEGVRRWDVSPPHLALFGTIAIQTGRFDVAENVYRRALSVDPAFEPAARALELLPGFRDGSLRIPGSSPQDPAPPPSGMSKPVDPPPSANR